MASPLSEDPGAIMRQAPLLALLNDEDIRALASRGRGRSYLPGDAIFAEGELGDEMHVVVRGSVRIHRLADTGSDVTLAVLGPGECVGEQALLDNLPRSANARAIQETRTFTVSRDVFMEWLRERPGAALALLETLSLRLRKSNEKVADLMFLDLAQRLSKTLLSLSDGNQPGHVVTTQAALGQLLGVSRESINKQLQAFTRDGLLSKSRGLILIMDPDRLRRIE